MMPCSEIEKLRSYLEVGEKELKAEEEKINEIIDNEACNFFSQYREEDKNPELENEFRESLRNIYQGRINQKRAFLDDISRRISRIENEFFTECA